MALDGRELEGLWTHLFGEPPCIAADPALLAQVLVKALPPAPPYGPHVGRNGTSATIYLAAPDG